MTVSSDRSCVDQNNKHTGIYYGYVIIFASLLILMATLSAHFAYGIFFKPILNEFGWSRTAVSGAFSLVWVIQGILGILAGFFTDRLGPRLVVTCSAVFLGAGYILMSQVTQIWHVYLFYGVFIGIGISSGIPLLSTIVRWFATRRSLMSGIAVTGSSIGALIGPPVANWLIATYDWRKAYIIMGACSMAIVLIAAQFLKRGLLEDSSAEERDCITKNSPRTNIVKDYPLSQAVYTLQFWLIFILFFCFGCCVYAIQVHIAPHITDTGISTARAAGILAVVGATGIVGRIGLGSLGDRIGNKKAFIIGFILIIAALSWLLTAHEIWQFYLFAVVFGAAFGNGIANQAPLVATFFGMKSHGILLGFLCMGYTFGAAGGPIILGHMYDIAGNYQSAFITIIVIALAGLFATFLLRRFK